jgi:hypothetical protein
MADITGYARATQADGTPILEALSDNGDGTYSMTVTTMTGAGVVGYAGYLDTNGAPIPVLFVAQGGGTYAELVSS